MTKDTPQKYVAIFQTDYAPDLKQQFGDYSEQSTAVLKKAGLQREVRVFDTIQLEYPSDEELNKDIQAIWITGSKADAFSDITWINTLSDYIERITVQFPQIPIVGICFGHQIVGRALGAKVGRNVKGWEYGVHEIQLNTEDEEVMEMFGHFGESFRIQEVHQDVVVQLPQGLKNIGSTEKTTYQGFYKKNHIITFQGHPEFTSDYLFTYMQVMKRKRTDLSEEFITTGEQKALESHHGNELTQVIIKHIESKQ